MEFYKTKNGLRMLKSFPLNWRVEKTYAVALKDEDNPDYLMIDVGSIDEMWSAILIPETLILSFCAMAYSKDEVYKFKVESIDEASQMVMKFAKGMNRLKDLEDTIYWNDPK